VRAEFINHRFNARIEDFNTVEAWRGFQAGDGFSNRRKPAVSTMNLSDLTPMRTIWTGHLYNPNPMYPPRTPPLFYATTEGQTPFRFHWHVSDIGHGAIFGIVGAGKSTLLQFMIAQAFKILGMQVFVFDRGMSSFILTKALGGEHCHFGNDRISAAPLINVDQEIERQWAHGYMVTLLRMALDRPLSPTEDDALWRALELLAKLPPHLRTVTSLQGIIQDPILKAGLGRYTLKGPMGQYLDANQDALLDNRLVTFELETLQHTEALIPVLLYLFHRIEQRLDGRPTFIVVDESWLALTKSFFGTKLEQWLRDCRKQNGAVWLATQSLDDVRRSEYRSVILESCASKIYLANPQALTPNMIEVYRDFGLNEKQIEIIGSEMMPKRHYLLVSPDGCREFDLELDPVTLSFVGVSSKEHIQRVRELIAEHGERWPGYWLRERGLPQAADEFERYTAEITAGTDQRAAAL
jgi:type IV secretion system protein VirB4